MNAENLRRLKPSEILNILHHQVGMAKDFWLSDLCPFNVKPTDDAIRRGALLAVGDFLIFPRFDDAAPKPGEKPNP